MSKELLDLERIKWKDKFLKLPKPYIAILIGGKSKAFNFSEKDCLNILKKIDQVIDLGWTPLISTSKDLFEKWPLLLFQEFYSQPMINYC